MSETAAVIRRFIDDELLDGPCDGDPLAEGRLDSLALEQLLAFIEDDLGVVLDDAEVTAEAFSAVKVVAALVDAKRASA